MLAVVLLLAWRDGALTVSPVAKLRAHQRRAARRAHSSSDTEFAGKPYPRSFIFSALFHSFCSYGFFCSLFLWVHIEIDGDEGVTDPEDGVVAGRHLL